MQIQLRLLHISFIFLDLIIPFFFFYRPLIPTKTHKKHKIPKLNSLDFTNLLVDLASRTSPLNLLCSQKFLRLLTLPFLVRPPHRAPLDLPGPTGRPWTLSHHHLFQFSPHPHPNPPMVNHSHLTGVPIHCEDSHTTHIPTPTIYQQQFRCGSFHP